MSAESDGRGGLKIGHTRYMMIRPDALMGLFSRLSAADRITAFDALTQSVLENGGKSAASYAGGGIDEAAALITRIEATAPQLGWGNWQITQLDNGLDLSVTNSPFAAGFGDSAHPVCAAIKGMLGAVTKQIFGRDAIVVEKSCTAMTSGDACNFTSRCGG
ncbi:MAG: hypothetical protein GWP36_03255 [Bacteroidetes bacterium]|jgi:predicted hydrocarbon binding protein|nr:hypothetical protein [Bacteroidota bacterium]